MSVTWDDMPPRQREVAQLVAAGLPDKLIARRLGITPGTVGQHLALIARRLGGDAESTRRHVIAEWVRTHAPMASVVPPHQRAA
jgi:DNA-binding CsgD family transcriptional regulator